MKKFSLMIYAIRVAFLVLMSVGRGRGLPYVPKPKVGPVHKEKKRLSFEEAWQKRRARREALLNSQPAAKPSFLSMQVAGISASDGTPVDAMFGALSLSEEVPKDLPTKALASSGIRYSNGLPISESGFAYMPVTVRGRGQYHGIFHDYANSSTTYRRALSNIKESLVTGEWNVEPGLEDDFTPDEVEEAIRRAQWSEKQLFNLQGGFNQFCEDCTYCLIGGFAWFEQVYHDVEAADDRFGAIRQLQFRFPSVLSSWVHSLEDGSLVAIKAFADPNCGTEVVIDANNILVVTYGRIGNNMEGNSPLRAAATWIDVLQDLTRIEMVAVEKNGAAWTFVSEDGGALGFGVEPVDRQELVDIIDAAIAEDQLVISLPQGVKITTTSPQGSVPDFSTGKQFAIERVAELLKSEGSLMGLGNVGAFAARDSAIGERISTAPYYAKKLVCDTINGSNNERFTGVIPKMEAAHFGAPIRPGVHSKLVYSVGQLEDPTYAGRIMTLAQAGVLQKSKSLIEFVHAREGFPIVKDAVASLTDAQVGVCVMLVEKLSSGALTRETTEQIMMRAFNIEKEEVAAILGKDPNKAN